MPEPAWRLPGYTPRRSAGLMAYERVLARAGLAPVAGIDEAGRGACAGPLVVAAVALDPRRAARCAELADSKALSAPVREMVYQQVLEAALAWHAVVIPSADIDRIGLHVCNVMGMRRALAGLATRPGFVLTDGFPVRGLAVPSLAMWKGDQVAACVAAASVVAKVTRDAIMRGLHAEYPQYGFARHKGYSTRGHMRALDEHGPSPVHRMSFANVISVGRGLAPLPAGLDTQLPPGVDPGFGPGLDPELSRGLDPELSRGLDPELSRGLDPELGTELSPGPDPGPGAERDPGLDPELAGAVFSTDRVAEPDNEWSYG